MTKRPVPRFFLTTIGVCAAGGGAAAGACGAGAGVRAGVNWIGCEGCCPDGVCGADSRAADCGAAPFDGVKGSGCAGDAAGGSFSCAGSREDDGLG